MAAAASAGDAHMPAATTGPGATAAAPSPAPAPTTHQVARSNFSALRPAAYRKVAEARAQTIGFNFVVRVLTVEPASHAPEGGVVAQVGDETAAISLEAPAQYADLVTPGAALVLRNTITSVRSRGWPPCPAATASARRRSARRGRTVATPLARPPGRTAVPPLVWARAAFPVPASSAQRRPSWRRTAAAHTPQRTPSTVATRRRRAVPAATHRSTRAVGRHRAAIRVDLHPRRLSLIHI